MILTFLLQILILPLLLLVLNKMYLCLTQQLALRLLQYTYSIFLTFPKFPLVEVLAFALLQVLHHLMFVLYPSILST